MTLPFLRGTYLPRNVDPSVNLLEGIYLYDVDALRSVAEQALAMRRQQMAAAEKIIAEHVEAFGAILSGGMNRQASNVLHVPVAETPSPSGAA